MKSNGFLNRERLSKEQANSRFLLGTHDGHRQISRCKLNGLRYISLGLNLHQMSHSNDAPPPDDPLLGPRNIPPPAAHVPDNSPPIYSGPVSLWMGFKTFFFSFVLALIGAGAAAMSLQNQGTVTQQPLLIGGVALFLASALMPLYIVFRIRSQRYTITRRLIEREQGIFVKKVDAVDLAKVKDVELSQSIMERMLNIGTIKIFSTDKTMPMMLIEAIPAPRPVYEQLRDAVIDIGRQRGVIGLDR